MLVKKFNHTYHWTQIQKLLTSNEITNFELHRTSQLYEAASSDDELSYTE